MLMALDDKGLVPDEMREAICKHAANSLETLPASLVAVASSLAAAVSGDVGLDNRDTANASWGMASLAEQMHGWRELAFCFGTKNTLAKA